jgi:tight adherence protein B
MALIAGLVFLGVFAMVALPMIAAALGPSRTARQMLATLDSALATESPETRAKIVNLRKEKRFSSIPWLNQKLRQLELVPHLQRMLDQADINWTAGKLLAASAVGFAFPIYLIYSRWGPVLAALPVGLLVGLTPIAWVFYARKRRFHHFQEGLPEALDLMVSGLRAGHSLIAAMGLVAQECADPVGTEFKTCFEEQNYGLELKTAIDNMLERVPLQSLRIMATAIMIQKESGGNLSEVLDKTAHAIREQFRLKRQIMVHTAQGRLTGVILTLLPMVLGLALYFVNPQMMSVLWTREIGVKLLWAAGGMTLLGGLIIHKIVNMNV